METPRTPVSTRHAYTYDWNAAEHRRAVRWMTWARLRRPLFRVVRVVLYVFLALVALVAIGMALDGYTREPIELGVLALLVGALVLWFPWLTAALITWRTGRTDPNVHHPMHQRFDAVGLHVSCRTAETMLRWDGMQRVVETPRFLFFYYSSQLAYYLPKRVVDDLPELRASIAEWLPEGMSILSAK